MKSVNARPWGLVVAGWLLSVILKRVRAGRASDQLVAAVVRQAQSEPDAEAPLRERLAEEATTALGQKRRSGHTLYELPWYIDHRPARRGQDDGAG